MPEWFLQALDREFSIQSPRTPGFHTVSAIEAMLERRARVFLALGGNFLSATPDTETTAKALRRCRLTVQISTKLNRSHLVTGTQALILPCLVRSERDLQAAGPQFVTVENSMGVVHSSQGRLDPISPDARSETAIVCEIARATLGTQSTIPWESFREDYGRIRDAIERVIPGFEDYNSRIRRPGGFYLPNGPRDRDFSGMPEGKARFLPTPVDRFETRPEELILMTIRSHDQFNTTVYGLDDRYRGIHNERRVLLMNPADLKERGLKDGAPVDITSHFEGVTRRAENFLALAYDVPGGCAAAYFPEANVLVPLTSTALHSHTPTSKSVRITVTPRS